MRLIGEVLSLELACAVLRNAQLRAGDIAVFVAGNVAYVLDGGRVYVYVDRAEIDPLIAAKSHVVTRYRLCLLKIMILRKIHANSNIPCSRLVTLTGRDYKRISEAVRQLVDDGLVHIGRVRHYKLLSLTKKGELVVKILDL